MRGEHIVSKTEVIRAILSKDSPCVAGPLTAVGSHRRRPRRRPPASPTPAPVGCWERERGENENTAASVRNGGASLSLSLSETPPTWPVCDNRQQEESHAKPDSSPPPYRTRILP